MNEPLPNPQRRLTSLELSAPARRTLGVLKKSFGMSYTHAVQSGLQLLLAHYGLGEAMPAGDRKALGLTTGPRPGNRKKGVAK